jgi:extracellular elastinolytic metalloproteinase
MKKLLYFLAFITVSFASAQDFTGVIDTYLDSKQAELGLQPQDIEDISISSQSYSKSMKLDNVYIVQEYQGIEIYNTNSSIAVKDGAVVSAKMAFAQNIAQKINTGTPVYTAAQAINSAASVLGIPSPTNLELLETVENNSFVYSTGNISLENIPVRLVYQPLENNTIRLAWDLSIYLLDASHYYSVRVDAVTGQLIDSGDWVVSCTFGETGFHSNHNNDSGNSILFADKAEVSTSAVVAGGGQYRVFPIPAESPNHGPEMLVADPSNSIASPFGWHDIDGATGAEFTITRGNNVYAYEDVSNSGSGASPDGGATLDFDFPFNLTGQPSTYQDAAITNLFYMNNILHDVLYQYGFDEEAGNFQVNNYGNAGQDGDFVRAEAQDGGGTNNANFSTPPDGAPGRMQMYIWTGATGPVADILTINNGPLAGVYSGIPAAFGGPIPNPALTEDLVVVVDDDAGTSTDPNDACDTILNGADLNGKIAVIRRGDCEFGFKALAAENEGAVAVIMVNNVPGPAIIMGAGAVGGSVTIPLFMISDVDGEPIIAELLAANAVNGTISGENINVDRDGDLDNGIIAHELGHGVSNRLTGGPAAASCLQNAEQMGEGWSDYIGLMLTMEQGDQAEDIRGIGTYATFEPVTGGGIREAPYSTDFAVNDYTYADTNNNVTQPHGIGFVWATMLWEMTWDIIGAYDGGAIGDIYNGTSGNNIALQLVMDGMKLQACSPGFIDGRDAILEADMLLYGGQFNCFIWKAFARRGLGLSASQGSSGSRTDQVEAFDIPASLPSGACDPLAVNDLNFDSNFTIYPNPSNGTVNIKSVLDVGEVNVSIVDLNGRTVFTQDMVLRNTVSINAENLATGVYVVQINGVNYTHTAKLIMN